MFAKPFKIVTYYVNLQKEMNGPLRGRAAKSIYQSYHLITNQSNCITT